MDLRGKKICKKEETNIIKKNDKILIFLASSYWQLYVLWCIIPLPVPKQKKKKDKKKLVLDRCTKTTPAKKKLNKVCNFFLPAFVMAWWHHNHRISVISGSWNILTFPKYWKHVNTGGMACMDLASGKEESSGGGLEFVANRITCVTLPPC